MILNVLVLMLALGSVIKAADWFLGAAESIGVRFALPPFVLGVLLVGFGTSLPELATSIAAVIDGVNNIAVANIVGSNLANMLLIVGISTFVLGTIKFDKDLIDLDLPLLFGVTALFAISIADGNLGSKDSLLLLTGFIGYIFYALFYKEEDAYHKGLLNLVRSLSRDTDSKGKVRPEVDSSLSTTLLILVGSVALLAGASAVSVDSLLSIVERLDVQVEVFTFFTVAIGTSLPELLVSYSALKDGKGDIVLGNIIGSSIFNILLIGGVSSALETQFIDLSLVAWSIVGLGVGTTMLVVSGITRRIHLWEGLVFLLVYVAVAIQLISA